MKIKKFSDIENQVNLIIKTSLSPEEAQQLSDQQLDYLKGTIFTHLAKTGKINKKIARKFFQDIIEKKEVF